MSKEVNKHLDALALQVATEAQAADVPLDLRIAALKALTAYRFKGIGKRGALDDDEPTEGTFTDFAAKIREAGSNLRLVKTEDQ